MKIPRRLSQAEAALWSRLASTVKPLRVLPKSPSPLPQTGPSAVPDLPQRPAKRVVGRIPPPPQSPTKAPTPQRPLDRDGLDATWDRKLARGLIAPDFTLDLHGHSLDAAHSRLEHGLALALAQGARVVLLVTGRSRPSDDHASRGNRRGAIRAKFLDWLAAGPHASRIAAIRSAHPRHGGAGAVYIVLKKPLKG